MNRFTATFDVFARARHGIARSNGRPYPHHQYYRQYFLRHNSLPTAINLNLPSCDSLHLTDALYGGCASDNDNLLPYVHDASSRYWH
jgi:hypothetical protein